jgi:hypothetical protein
MSVFVGLVFGIAMCAELLRRFRLFVLPTAFAGGLLALCFSFVSLQDALRAYGPLNPVCADQIFFAGAVDATSPLAAAAVGALCLLVVRTTRAAMAEGRAGDGGAPKS